MSLDAFYSGVATQEPTQVAHPVEESTVEAPAPDQSASPEVPISSEPPEANAQPNPSAPSVDWSSFGEFDSEETFRNHYTQFQKKYDQVSQELERVRSEDPFANPLVKNINDYLSKAETDDPGRLIQEYLEIQHRDFGKMGDDALIKMMWAKEKNLPGNIVDLLYEEQYTGKELPQKPEEGADYEEMIAYQRAHEQASKRNQVTEAQKMAEAQRARQFFNKLKKETALPAGYQDREAAKAAAEQKRQQFMQNIPSLTKEMEMNFNFGEGRIPFKFQLTPEYAAAVGEGLKQVAGAEDLDESARTSVMQFLAFSNPDIQQAMMASVYKHIESAITEDLHKQLGIQSTPTATVPATGVLTGASAADQYYNH